jgi:hypothetical protein
MTLLPKVKLKSVVNFPASVNGGTGVDVNKSHGTYTIDLDYSEFGVLASAPPNTYALIYDPLTGSYALAPGGGNPPATVPPLMDAMSASVGTATKFAREDHVHPTDTASFGVPIEFFGGAADGLTDNAAALDAALAYLAATKSGGWVQFGRGQYNFSRQVLFTYPNKICSIGLKGVGQDATVLRWATGNGLWFIQVNSPTASLYTMLSATHVHDLTMAVGAANNGVALTIANNSICGFYNYPLNSIVNVCFRGDDGFAIGNYWQICVQVYTAGFIAFDTVNFMGGHTLGTGVSLQGNNTTAVTNAPTASGNAVLHFASVPAGVLNNMFVADVTNIPALAAPNCLVQSHTSTTVTLTVPASATVNSGDTIAFTNSANGYQFEKCNWTNCQYGVVISTGVQGVFFDKCAFTGGQTGIIVPGSQAGLVEMQVSDSQFNSTAEQIAVLSNFVALNFHNSLFFQTANTAAIRLDQNQGFVITDNIFNGPGTGSATAISVGTTAGGSTGFAGVISGNAITSFQTGISLSAGSASVNVDYSNQYNNVGTKVSVAGTNNQVISGVTGNGTNQVLQNSPTIAQPILIGVGDGSSAGAGIIGQVLSGTGAAVTTPNNTPFNVASVTLSAGDWEVSATIKINPAATTQLFNIVGSMSATTAGLDLGLGNCTEIYYNAAAPGAGFTPQFPLPTKQVTVATPTTYYLVGYIGWGTAAPTTDGIIRARRIR